MSKVRLGIVVVLLAALGAFGAGCGGDDAATTSAASTPSTSTPAATTSTPAATTSTPAATTSTPAAAGTGDVAAGKTLFEGKCQGCHANLGTEAATGPVLAGGGRTADRIRNQVVNGSPSSGVMPAGLYSGAELDNVVAFVLSIQ